jgi:hypothetical protein
MISIKIILHKNVLTNYIIKSILQYIVYFYLKPTEACQTKASSKKKIGIDGKTSITGLKTT